MDRVPQGGWESVRRSTSSNRSIDHNTVALFGLPITNVNMEQAIKRVDEYILSGVVHQIATANLDFARNALHDPYLHSIICDCSMVLPDGAPMLWASKMFGAPLQERVTGVDLVPALAKLAADRGYRVYFLGSSEESSSTAVKSLLKRFPKLNIVGRSCPPVATLPEMDNEKMLLEIHAARPNIIFIGFGNPKQEIWIHRHKDRLPPSVVIGIGGALDMIAGTLHRAPRWIQSLQMEWMYRMAQEPGRLMPRYLRDAKALLRHLPRGVMANRMQPFERRQRGSAVEVVMGARVFATPGKIGDRASALLLEEAKTAAAAGETLVVDMSATLRIEAEGIGGLLDARRVMVDAGLSMWLAAISTPVVRVLQFSAVGELFGIAVTPMAAIEASQSDRPSRFEGRQAGASEHLVERTSS
jgi:N-acetylglucosaminyldiphosphoundecaprenol N-acetyl-beta-D-mannosaminyltransferase